MHPPGRIRWSAPLSRSSPSQALIPVLARALIAGEQTPEAASHRLAQTLGRPWRWITPLCHRFYAIFAPHPRPTVRSVTAFLRNDRRFLRARERHPKSIRIAQWTTEPAQMAPVRAAQDWSVPPIETSAALAAWLNLNPEELAWFGDPHHLNSRAVPRTQTSTPLHHYHYKLLPKVSGTPRLIEVPKPRLKQLQRQVLRHILDPIPAHPAVHGFRKHRSVATYAAPHAGKAVVLRMDLADFFPSFSAARVHAFFRTAGYPDPVATLLSGLCINIAPGGVWTRTTPALPREDLSALKDLYGKLHLPQGAPTSPALANALSWRLDRRLFGLAHSAGATYTRYADDLAFSGPEAFANRTHRFSLYVANILREEGFAPNHRKTRIMRQGVRQHLAGAVINQRLNVARPDYDRLKATLHNCVRLGPSSQNRDALPDYRRHLEGRLSWLASLHPTKALRLRSLFEHIDWSR